MSFENDDVYFNKEDIVNKKEWEEHLKEEEKEKSWQFEFENVN